MSGDLPARLQTKYATDLLALKRMDEDGPPPLGAGGWQGVAEILFAALEDIAVHLNRVHPNDEQFRVSAVAIANRRLLYFRAPPKRYVRPKPTAKLLLAMSGQS